MFLLPTLFRGGTFYDLQSSVLWILPAQATRTIFSVLDSDCKGAFHSRCLLPIQIVPQ